ncbi:hypothetical protein E1301_Tti007354 [Triplophysa tibetana]|uniref:Uncharacterized protein n=1 Tax=Triplophysa tibetana TaxID=1572043 RepID=A0A5A9P0F9_9TELE|nr:hypothetical protein E1301_Tti007354 [Triplophysa tibetana]
MTVGMATEARVQQRHHQTLAREVEKCEETTRLLVEGHAKQDSHVPLAQYVKLLLPSNAPECMDTYSSTPSISQSAINADSRSPGGPADLLNRLCCIAA